MSISAVPRNYDLHCHSSFSDGTLPVEALVHYAVEQGVDVLALTDHDSTEGIALAQSAAASTALQLVAGVEISATWAGRTVHIVGLNIDISSPLLQTGLQNLRDLRNRRAQAITERLEKKGVEGVAEGLEQLVEGSILSRTHFARYLVQAGYAKDMAQAFKKFLTKGAPAYVAGDWAQMGEVVQWIRSAGGMAVIAHPGRYRLGNARLRQLVADFRDCGGDAIEVFSGSQPQDDGWRFTRLSQEFGLLASVGSDYHGPEQHWVQLGRMPKLPAECVPVWQDWQLEKL